MEIKGWSSPHRPASSTIAIFKTHTENMCQKGSEWPLTRQEKKMHSYFCLHKSCLIWIKAAVFWKCSSVDEQFQQRGHWSDSQLLKTSSARISLWWRHGQWASSYEFAFWPVSVIQKLSYTTKKHGGTLSLGYCGRDGNFICHYSVLQWQTSCVMNHNISILISFLWLLF